MVEMKPESWSAISGHLRLLGYGGLIPFVALALGGWVLADTGARIACLSLLQAYGLAIVSFVGALSWGVALVAPDPAPEFRRRLLLWSVVPSLIGWVSYALPLAASFLILAATAALALLIDLRVAPGLGLPEAWLRLRTHLSLGAMAALTLGSYAARGLAG